MQRLEFSGAVRPIYGSLGVKRLISIKLGLRRKNAAPYFVSPSVATVDRNALVNR